MSRLKELLSSGRPALGAWIVIGDPYATELVCRSGVDWVGIDLQHGLAAGTRVEEVIRSTEMTQTPALARVAWNEPAAIMRALDLGACGVIVPMIGSAEEAGRAVAACRYPPHGERSLGPVRSAFPAEAANDHVLCLPMVETADALANLDEIAATPGVDGLFVGPSDLALSLGLPVNPTDPHPEEREAIARVAAACEANGIVAGIFCGGASIAGEWIAGGYRLVALDSDAAWLAQAARAALAEVRR
jgi:4-hydroxy-2-oxoheptanedioate aldolase